MRQADRLAAILERLSENGGVGVSDLARDLATSPATVRRDLRLLEQQRLLSRTHGGAVAHGVLYELPLRYRGARHGEEKRRIASAAAEGVEEGMVVGLTGGAYGEFAKWYKWQTELVPQFIIPAAISKTAR